MSTTIEVAPAQVEVPQKQWQGQNVPRKEDKRLTQGQGVFVDDIKRHGMGYLHFVRSPYAHAHITSIDVSKAEALGGVYGTLTGEEDAVRAAVRGADLEPPSDVHASSEYRAHLAEVLAVRAARQAAERS